MRSTAENTTQRKKLKMLLAFCVIPTAGIILGACSSSDDDDNATQPVQFDEASGGDLSDDPNNPQPFQLAIGQNQIAASMVDPDLDYITVNVPAGTELTAINVDSYDSENAISFIAIQTSSVFTELASSPDVANLLGYAHFGADDVGNDILSNISAGEGAQGFTPPLQAGDYSFWMQETGSAPVDVAITFDVTDVDG